MAQQHILWLMSPRNLCLPLRMMVHRSVCEKCSPTRSCAREPRTISCAYLYLTRVVFVVSYVLCRVEVYSGHELFANLTHRYMCIVCVAAA